MFIFITMFDATPPTLLFFFFFFNDTATTEIYTLSLHDALPISMLSLKRRDAGRNMVIFRNSWSLDASTIPAFERMFSLQAASTDNSLHLLAMARAAGYKTWWVSNHDDVAIESRHASYADIVEIGRAHV